MQNEDKKNQESTFKSRGIEEYRKEKKERESKQAVKIKVSKEKIPEPSVEPMEKKEQEGIQKDNFDYVFPQIENRDTPKKFDLAGSSAADKFKISMIEDYEEEEAKRLIEEALGFEPFPVAGWQIAVKVYVRPEDIRSVKTDDGREISIYLPDTARSHDKYIQCVGLVLRVGNLCYSGKYFEEPWYRKILRKFFNCWMEPNKYVPWCKVGDWVVFDRNSGPQFNYRGVPITVLEDKHIRAVIPDPSYVTRY